MEQEEPSLSLCVANLNSIAMFLSVLCIFLDMPLRSTRETTELGMALDRPMKSLRCHFIAFIIIDGPTSCGKLVS